MKKEDLLKRIQELSKSVQESLENHQRIRVALENATNSHNALVGRLDEATVLYKEFDNFEKSDVEKALKAECVQMDVI